MRNALPDCLASPFFPCCPRLCYTFNYCRCTPLQWSHEAIVHIYLTLSQTSTAFSTILALTVDFHLDLKGMVNVWWKHLQALMFTPILCFRRVGEWIRSHFRENGRELERSTDTQLSAASYCSPQLCCLLWTTGKLRKSMG